MSGGFYKRSTVVRISLQDLWSAKTPKLNIKSSDTMKGGYYGFARGCTDAIYFASVGNTTTMRIFRWRGDSGLHSAVDRTISRWYSGFSISKLRDGKNWLAADNRTIQTGYKLGGEVVFLFDSNKGGTFKHPFIRVSRFRTSNLTLVKEHNISASSQAWAFPSVTVGRDNKTVAVSAYVGGQFIYPTMQVGFVDGINNWDWDKFQSTRTRYGYNSTHNQRWGFRSNVMEHPDFPGNYLAAGQVMTASGTADANCEHRVVWFSRSNRKPTATSLSVTSTNVPVTINLDVASHGGATGGKTNFTRNLWSNQGYVLRAPHAAVKDNATWIFDRWVLNGNLQPVNELTLTVNNVGTVRDNAEARYVRGYRMSTRSLHAMSANYTLSPPDSAGTNKARTNYTHAFKANTTVTIQFTQSVGNRKIYGLQSTGVTPTNAYTMTIKMDRDRSVVAIYGSYRGSFVGRYGTACSGTNGTPRHRTNGQPEIGQTFVHRLENGVRNGRALAVAGLSKTNWNGTSLPFTFPGTTCKILTAPQFFVATGLDSFGNAKLPINIPNQRSLLGLGYFAQFAIHDPSTPLGFTTTEAYQVVIGGWDLR